MKIDFEQPYVFLEGASTEELLKKARVRVTTEMVLQAAAQMYPNGMRKKEARLFRPFVNAFTNEDASLEVTKDQFEFLYKMFCSERADNEIKIAPTGSGWFLTWCDYLERLAKDEGAPE